MHMLLVVLLTFHVERALGPDGPWTVIATVPLHDPEFPDRHYQNQYADWTVLPETTYWHRVSNACNLTIGGVYADVIHMQWTRRLDDYESPGLMFTSKTALAWDRYDRGTAEEAHRTVHYDFAVGVIGYWDTLSGCTSGIPWTAPTSPAGGDPQPGVGWWYLVRTENACGPEPWTLPLSCGTP